MHCTFTSRKYKEKNIFCQKKIFGLKNQKNPSDFRKNNYVKDSLHWFWQTNMYLTKSEPKNPDLLTKSLKFVISKAVQKSIILTGYMMTDLKWSNTLTLTAEKVMINSGMEQGGGGGGGASPPHRTQNHLRESRKLTHILSKMSPKCRKSRVIPSHWKFLDPPLEIMTLWK